MKLTPERIAEIEAAEKAATEGSDGLGGLEVVHLQAERDAAKDLIVAAIPELLAEHEELKREIERLKSQVERLESRVDEPCVNCSETRADALEKDIAALRIKWAAAMEGNRRVNKLIKETVEMYAEAKAKLEAMKSERGEFAGFCDLHPSEPLSILDTNCEKCMDEHRANLDGEEKVMDDRICQRCKRSPEGYYYYEGDDIWTCADCVVAERDALKKQIEEVRENVREGIALGEGEVAAEKLARNIVKQEFWKGELSAYRQIETALNRKGEEKASE